MSHVSILAVLISGLAYFILYLLFFSNSLFGNKLNDKEGHVSEQINPFSIDKLIIVLACGLIYSFFLALFMIMAERSGMADGIKTGFLLCLIQFCIPMLIYFRLNNLSWNQYLKYCAYALCASILSGGLIGYWS